MPARLLLLALLPLTVGCSGYWGRRRLDLPEPIESRVPVWIWSGGDVRKWHDVLITQDSVSGIPYELPRESYRDRRSIALSQVDSMKVGYHTFPESALLTVGVVTAALVAEGVVCYLLQVKGEC